MSFNHFRVKRDAHLLEAGGWPDPFARIWRASRLARRHSDTWDTSLNNEVASSYGRVTEPELVLLQRPVTEPPLLQRPADFEADDGRSDQTFQLASAVTSAESNERPRVRIEPFQFQVSESALGTPDFGDSSQSGSFREHQRPVTHDVTLAERKQKHRFFRNVQPKCPFTVANQLRNTLLSAWANILLVCSPVGFCLDYLVGRSVPTFVVNLVAALPLLKLNDIALFEIALRVGDRVGGLIYIFTCNIVQLISCVVLMRSGQGNLVQLTVVGSILANLLFILGISIISGSWNRKYQYFQQAVAHVSSNLLSLASTSLLVPTASSLLEQVDQKNLVRQSRGASVILIMVYISYMLYQLLSHKDEFDEKVESMPAKSVGRTMPPGTVRQALVVPAHPVVASHLERPMSVLDITQDKEEKEEEPQDPTLHFVVAVALFAATTTLLYFCIDFAVSSIDALTSTTPVSKTFVSLILLPLPNCDFSAIHSARADRMDMAMNFTIGKCLQTALLITPLVVLIAWGLGMDDVTLVFDGFEVVSLFAAILLLNFLMIEGRVSWIQGVLLLADWGLIALVAFFAMK